MRAYFIQHFLSCRVFWRRIKGSLWLAGWLADWLPGCIYIQHNITDRAILCWKIKYTMYTHKRILYDMNHIWCKNWWAYIIFYYIQIQLNKYTAYIAIQNRSTREYKDAILYILYNIISSAETNVNYICLNWCYILKDTIRVHMRI